jgi:hypothetical protein
VVSLAAWRVPPAGIGDVIAIDAMDAGDHRVLVELAAIGLRDVESILLRFRRPGNDAADIVAFGAESTPANRQNQRGHKEWALSHAAPQS